MDLRRERTFWVWRVRPRRVLKVKKMKKKKKNRRYTCTRVYIYLCGGLFDGQNFDVLTGA